MKRIDLSNTQIGYWQVGEAFTKSNGRIYYHCTCECGKQRDVYGSALNRGVSKSCGCKARVGKGKDRIGERYGSLLVIGTEVINNRTHWICKCDCGNRVSLLGTTLEARTSCGCRMHFKSAIVQALDKHLQDGTYIPGLKRTKLNSNNSSGYTGVGYRPERGKWRASIRFRRKSISLGHYDTKEEAIEARKEGELKFFGKYLEEDDVR